MRTTGKKPVLETSPSTAGPTAAAALGSLATAEPSRGYREELEHFAYCVRHGNASNYHADTEHQPRCRGEVALADAVIALTSNIAMRQNRRIDFDPDWFDYKITRDARGLAGHREKGLTTARRKHPRNTRQGEGSGDARTQSTAR